MLALSFGRIAIKQIEPQIFREIVTAWCAQRDDRVYPLKEQIDPFLVPSLTANVILYEVEDRDLIFRVLGEKVLTTVGSNPKGKTLREALGESDYVLMVESQLLECAATGVPLYSVHDFQLPTAALGAEMHRRKAWRIALPYGEENRVTRLLCYQLFSEEIEAPFRKEIDYARLLPKTVFKIDV